MVVVPSRLLQSTYAGCDRDLLVLSNNPRRGYLYSKTEHITVPGGVAMPRRERARLATGSATPSAMTTSAPSTSTTTSSGGVMLTMAALAAVGASSLAADATVLGEGPSSLLSVGNRRFSTCRCEGAAAVATNCDAIAFSTGTTGDHELCSSLPSEWRERKSVGRCRRVCRNAEQKEEERWGWNKLQVRVYTAVLLIEKEETRLPPLPDTTWTCR